MFAILGMILLIILVWVALSRAPTSEGFSNAPGGLAPVAQLLSYGDFDQWGPTINFKPNQRQTGGTIGNFPTIPLATSCSQCRAYSAGTHGGVCQNCGRGPTNYGGDLGAPLYVGALAAGWPRVTRDLTL